MNGTVISLFGDYARRYKADQSPRGGTGQENASVMPTSVPRKLTRRNHRRGESYPQVEISKRLLCTANPASSLQSQSLPKISLRGNAARQQRHRGNYPSPKGKPGLAIPVIKCCTTQSLPSLSNSNSSTGKSPGKETVRGPRRSSTFDLFQTSRHGRRTASRSQNFSWDFSPRSGIPKIYTDTENNRTPKHGERKVETSRPVHLYMSIEMMDKLLEKRKGLRSDDMLNELIGLPPTKVRVSASRDQKRPQRGVKDGKSQVPGQHPRNAGNQQNASNCEEVTKAVSSASEKCIAGTPQEEPQDGDQGSNNMETETGNASGVLMGEEDDLGNQIEEEFEDEEEEELGGLDNDDKSSVFDGCEDDEEDDADEINDDADSEDEGRGTGQDGDEEDREQVEEIEDEDDLEDGEAQGDEDEEDEEEVEEVGIDDNDGEEEARQDADGDDDYEADDNEMDEGQESEDEEDADEEDGRTEAESEMDEELDEPENDEDEISDIDDDDDEQKRKPH